MDVTTAAERPAPEPTRGAARLLLLGAATSGSTLLGAYLALSPDVSALGESCEHRRTNLMRHRCTCGATVGTCPVWGDVLWTAIERRWTDVEVLAAVARSAHDVDGSRWIADSVKHPAAYAAQGGLGIDDETRGVLLVRHPCGYAVSQLAHDRELDHSTRRWCHDHRQAVAFLSDHGIPFDVVRYEDLAGDPQVTLDGLSATFGLRRPEGGCWEFKSDWGPRHHILVGSRWRFDGPPSTVAPDERWRTVLDRSQQRRVLASVGELAEQLDYRL